MFVNNFLIMKYSPSRIVRTVIRIPLRAYKASRLRRELQSRKSDLRIQNVEELNLLMKGRAYLHNLELPLLARYAQTADDTIVEIGCAYGASSAVFLAHIPVGVTLHSIDPFIVDSMSTFQATKDVCLRNVRHVLTALSLSDKLSQWSLHPDYSYTLAPTWTTPIDTLFIDGDHNYDAVRRDLDDWFPHMKTGGHILFHDSRKESGTPAATFNRGWAGPTRLAEELRTDSRVKLIDEAFSITVWEKVV